MPKTITLAAMNWGFRLVGAVVQLATINILHEKLGDREFSVFSVLMAASIWYQLIDLGMTMPSHNAVANRLTRQNALSKVLVDPFLGGVVGMALWIVFVAFFENSPGGLDRLENWTTMIFVGVSFVVYGISAYFSRILYALNLGVHGASCLVLGQIMSFLAVRFGFQEMTGKQAVMAWVYIQNIPIILFSVAVLIRSGIRIEWRGVRAYRAGMPFLASNFLAFSVLQVDVFVVGYLCDDKITGGYFALTRLLGLIYFAYNSVLMISAPKLVEHVVQRSSSAIRKELQFVKTIGFSVVVAFFGSLLLFREFVVGFYPAVSSVLTPAIVLVFMAYYLIRVITDAQATFMQSMGDVGIFHWMLPIQCCVNTLAIIAFAPRFGVLGVGIAYCCSFTVMAIALALKAKQMILKLEANECLPAG